MPVDLGALATVPLTRAGVAQVVDALREREPGHGLAAAEAALDRLDGRTACLLLFAVAAERELPHGLVLRALPLLPNVWLTPPLVSRCAESKVDMLAAALESGRVPVQWAAMLVLLATVLLDGAPPPSALLVHARRIARERLDLMPAISLGHAARLLDDAALTGLAAVWIAEAELAGPGVVDRVRADLGGPLLERLPEQELVDPTPKPTFTIRRPLARVGRNDPCPCGSGKKHKKCCAGKDAARSTDPSPVAGVTMTEYRAAPHLYMSALEFSDLPLVDLAAVDAKVLPTAHLRSRVMRLTRESLLPEAERDLEALAARTDLADDINDHRCDLVDAALEAGARDVATRQVARMDEESMTSDMRAIRAILVPDAGTLACIETSATSALHCGQSGPAVDFAHGLLLTSPGLGLLVARGILMEETVAACDVDVLASAVERARDQLGLAPGDPVQERCDDVLLNAVAARLPAPDAGDPALAREAERLRNALREATGRLAELEEQRRQARPSSAPTVATPEADAAARRLKEKVEELKDRIREGNEERRRLRSEVSQLAGRLEEERTRPQARSPRDGEPPDMQEVELDDPDERRTVLVPALSDAAAQQLRRLPKDVGSRALRLLGTLAGAEQSAWHGVKALRAAPGLLSARVGIHHRLLFRVDAEHGRLVVVHLVHRRELEETIRREA